MTSVTPLVPARFDFTAEGVPRSPVYDDVYHSRAGALGQAQHVFLAGNGLPERWAAQRDFAIVETGFGLGLNFLATWAAWQADPARCARLHYIAFELHPFSAADLQHLHAAWPELAAFATELRAHWPALVPGVHRLHLAGGAIVLTLGFGDAQMLLEQFDMQVDAVYLDGFAPARNPAMWSASLLARITACTRPGATLATWSVAGGVRRTLTTNGFTCTRQPGYAGKRDMLVAARNDAPSTSGTVTNTERTALIIGAGLAGSAIANRLSERGWQLTVFDAAAQIASGASGNLAGVLRPLPSLDDNPLARLTRAGTLYGLHHLQRLAARGLYVRAASCGALHLARDDRQAAKMQAIVTTHGYPEDYLQWVDRAAASALAGCEVACDGWWMPRAGWVNPPDLCAANLHGWPQGRITLRLGTTVATLEHDGECWHAFDPTGIRLASAPCVILANGTGITRFAQTAGLPVHPARGQVSHLPTRADDAPHCVVCRGGYTSPAVDGWRCVGATFAMHDTDPELRASDHAENLATLRGLLPDDPALDAPLAGRVGFRPASPDRLPIVGAVPHAAGSTHALPPIVGLYAVSGFGARGLVWSSLIGEHLAARLSGELSPLPRDLADALEPARFWRRLPTRTDRKK